MCVWMDNTYIYDMSFTFTIEGDGMEDARRLFLFCHRRCFFSLTADCAVEQLPPAPPCARDGTKGWFCSSGAMFVLKIVLFTKNKKLVLLRKFDYFLCFPLIVCIA